MSKINELIANAEVEIAETPADREAVYHFRYCVYVDEMGKELFTADHENKRLSDELDRTALIFYIEIDGEIATTIRVNLLRDGNIPEFLYENYALDRIEKLHGVISLTSKLMVSEKWRNTLILSKLLFFVYNYARENNVRLDFCYCAPMLVKFYECMGYRRYKSNYIDEEVGYRIPLFLLLEDIGYLYHIHSPFYRLARKWENKNDAAECFFDEFHLETEYVGAQLTNADEFWNNLSQQLHDESIPLFKGLETGEIDEFLKKSAVLQCKEGDYIIRTDDVGNEMFLIISGAAEVSKQTEGKKYTVATFGKGDIFGEMAFLSAVPRSADVVTMIDMEVVVLTRQFFQQIMTQLPEVSSKILLNLSVILCERLRASTQNWVDTISTYSREE